MSRSFVASIVTADHTITATLSDGLTVTVSSGHPNYAALKEAFKNKDAEAFVKAYDETPTVAGYVAAANSGRVTVKNGRVYFDGEQVHNAIADRISEMMTDGEDFESMVKFLENLMQNPSSNSRAQLYSFLGHKNLPMMVVSWLTRPFVLTGWISTVVLFPTILVQKLALTVERSMTIAITTVLMVCMLEP